MKLTDSVIRAAKPKSTPYTLSDGRGLVLYVQPTGSRWWRFRYRYNDKQQMLSFGVYPDVSLSEARDRVTEARKLLVQSVNPSAHRQEKKRQQAIAASNSFQSVGQQWFDHWRNAKVESHVTQIQAMLERYIYPAIGSVPVTELTPQKLIATLKKIEANDAPSIARRAHGTCGQILRYAVANGMAERNPVADFLPGDVLKPRIKKHFARLSESELPELLQKIDDYNGQPLTKLALQLMALTFVRTSELIGARWGEIELDKKQWRIPAERMKMKTQHIVPLSDQAIVILEKIHAFTGGDVYVFPSQRGDGRTMSPSTLLSAIRRMGFNGRHTVHGFRGIASTILHERGYSHEHIELQLAHSPRDAVSAAYNHSLYLEQRTKLMSDWAEYLDSLRK